MTDTNTTDTNPEFLKVYEALTDQARLIAQASFVTTSAIRKQKDTERAVLHLVTAVEVQQKQIQLLTTLVDRLTRLTDSEPKKES